MTEAPRVQAFVLADHVYQDVLTGKMIIAGTFSVLLCGDEDQSDCRNLGRSTFAYLSLTDYVGKGSLELRYFRASDNALLLHFGPVSISSDDKLKNHELVVEVPSLPMPSEGIYIMEAVLDDVPISSIRLRVHRREMKHHGR